MTGQRALGGGEELRNGLLFETQRLKKNPPKGIAACGHAASSRCCDGAEWVRSFSQPRAVYVCSRRCAWMQQARRGEKTP